MISSQNYAAGLARAHNGGVYTDWYLPNKDELAKLHAMKRLGFGGFADDWYWSSTETIYNIGSYDGAWAQYFLNGEDSFNMDGSGSATSKSNPSPAVRAVRAF